MVETARADGTTERVEIAALERDLTSPVPDDLDLRLDEARELLLFSCKIKSESVSLRAERSKSLARRCSSSSVILRLAVVGGVLRR